MRKTDRMGKDWYSSLCLQRISCGIVKCKLAQFFENKLKHLGFILVLSADNLQYPG